MVESRMQERNITSINSDDDAAETHPVSKSEHVYTELRNRILQGDYRAGHRLVLSRVGEQFGTSPVPVREAIRRLEAEGLVRYTRNVGAEVVGVDEKDYAQAMQTLSFIEGGATALAAPHLSSNELARARALNDAMRDAAQRNDAISMTSLNQAFHQIICDPCPNRHMLDLLGKEWERLAHIRRSTFTWVPERAHQSVEEHDLILELIETGAPQARIEIVARAHKLRTLKKYLDFRRSAPTSQLEQAVAQQTFDAVAAAGWIE